MISKYKDSGIEWIGEIPKNWDLPKVKQLFYIGRGRVISQLDLEDSGYPVYSSQTKNNGCLGYIKTYDFDRSQLTWTTDGANAGTVFLREGKHNCTNVCGTLMPKTENNNLVFLKFALEYIATFHKRADINGYKIMNNEMAEIRVVLPTLEEQQKIADFLDKKCSHIDSVLDKTKASIEEYKKLKQAVITQAVTKGIRPNRPMKDSGIEWIGEIPEGWGISKIKFVSHFNPQYTIVPHEGDVVTFAPMDCIKNGYYINKESVYNKANTSYTPFQEGDIVMAKVTPCFENGNIAIMAGLSSGYGYGSSELFVLRPKNINTKFLFYYLQNQMFKKLACSTMTGTGGLKRVSPVFVQNCSITIPIKTEQEEIADYLDIKCAEIDKLIEKKEQLISELETYKKSLIYEYVTGKKEVC